MWGVREMQGVQGQLNSSKGLEWIGNSPPLTLFGMTYVIYDIGFNQGIFLKKTLSRRNLN